MGCCQQSVVVKESKDATKKQYTLNAMRSLEGVARLWSKHIEKLESENMAAYNGENPSLKATTSVPVNGNHNAISNHLPIAISTYFFLKSPHDQPNLIQSHTSPNQRSVGNKLNKRTTLNDVQNTVINENESMDMDIDFNEEQNSNDNQIIELSPNLMSTDAIPNLNLGLMPVFSNSQSMHLALALSPDMHRMASPDMHTPAFCLTPFELNENESVAFPETINNIAIDPFGNMKTTYSENNVFTLSDMDLNENDFMEYETNNIGFGASGVVTKAFHFSSCQLVAIKHTRSKQKREILAFEQEAKLYKTFKRNANIINLIGFGKDEKNNGSMMALELMDLNSTYSLKISENIQDMKQRELVLAHIAFNVLLALNDLHEHLYVHNDIKPENILANKYGEIKLSDFGTILQLTHSDDFLYINNGTQKFQSPEKTTFNIKYNTKSDIWSFGITLYELLFGETNTNEISYTTNPPKLYEDKHNLSKNCCDFINKCLIINQFDRASADELLQHVWFTEPNIQSIPLENKWKWVSQKQYNNEDLLFMISALILYYSTKRFNDANSGSIQNIHRRVSIKAKHKNGGEIFSDEHRIANIAKYAFCSKDHVIDRIKVTVSYIKSQLNKTQ